jgi:soluble lytic murein transglycosylase-like protein
VKLLTRSLAALTVIGAFLATPLLSRIAPAHPGAVTEPAWAGAPGAIPPDWSSRIVRQLVERRFPVDESELAAIVGHAEVAAARFGLDPFTVLALIEIESGFNPFAVSPAEAKGLMQVREDTAREVAQRIGVAWESGDLLFDPATNVLIGTAYFRELLDRFGEIDVALAAFHAGPGRFAGVSPRLGPVSVEYTDRVWTSILRLYQTARNQSHFTAKKGDGTQRRA